MQIPTQPDYFSRKFFFSEEVNAKQDKRVANPGMLSLCVV